MKNAKDDSTVMTLESFHTLDEIIAFCKKKNCLQQILRDLMEGSSKDTFSLDDFYRFKHLHEY